VIRITLTLNAPREKECKAIVHLMMQEQKGNKQRIDATKPSIEYRTRREGKEWRSTMPNGVPQICQMERPLEGD